MKLMSWEFKTMAGASKRAAFENAHCNRKYAYRVVRFHQGYQDIKPLYPEFMARGEYTWKLERTTRRHDLASN